MKNPSLLRSASSAVTLLALACAFGLVVATVTATAATDSVTVQPLADQTLPLSSTFEKVESTEGTPFVLNLKNDSKAALKVSGKVLLSVVHHAMDKARVLPEQTIEAGQVWSIKGLAADDRVILSAPGYAPLEVRVPFKL